MFADSHDITLADPDPEAGGEAAEEDCADGESNELESCNTDALEETGFVLLGGVGLWKSGKGGKGAAYDIGHERGHSTCDDGGENGGEEEKEEMTAGELGEEKLDGGGGWGSRTWRGCRGNLRTRFGGVVRVDRRSGCRLEVIVEIIRVGGRRHRQAGAGHRKRWGRRTKVGEDHSPSISFVFFL